MVVLDDKSWKEHKAVQFEPGTTWREKPYGKIMMKVESDKSLDEPESNSFIFSLNPYAHQPELMAINIKDLEEKWVTLSVPQRGAAPRWKHKGNKSAHHAALYVYKNSLSFQLYICKMEFSSGSPPPINLSSSKVALLCVRSWSFFQLPPRRRRLIHAQVDTKRSTTPDLWSRNFHRANMGI